jgi:hypothetical protein
VATENGIWNLRGDIGAGFLLKARALTPLTHRWTNATIFALLNAFNIEIIIVSGLPPADSVVSLRV